MTGTGERDGPIRGDAEEALAQYQRCVESARDAWPSNWARHRIGQLTRAAQAER